MGSCSQLEDSSMVTVMEIDTLLLEKLRVASIVVRMAPLSLRRALNFLRQSTVSWRCKVEATRSRWHIQGCLSASAAVIRLAGFTVSIELIRFLASGVTVSHSGEGYYKRAGLSDQRNNGLIALTS